MAASASATAARLQRAVSSNLAHPSNVRKIAGNLSTAAIGVGTYHIKNTDGLVHALKNTPMNFIDTSTHYGPSFPGEAEMMIGAAIKEAGVAREDLIIATKVGHLVIDGKMVDADEARNLASSRYNDVVKSGDKVWHCLDPTFIIDEVQASALRLGSKPDIVYLHNPEFYLAECMSKRVPLLEAWESMYDRLQKAFACLEALSRAGEIHGYGVSGNFLSCYYSVTGRANSYEALDLQRTLSAIADMLDAAPKINQNNFGAFVGIQVPLNPIECGATQGRKNVVPGSSGEADASVCRRLGLSVVGNRPLTAIPPNGMNVTKNEWSPGSDRSMMKFRDDEMPVPPLQRLLKKVLQDEWEKHFDKTPFPKLAQACLKLTSSDADLMLNGCNSVAHVQDAAAVLKSEALPKEVVNALYAQMKKGSVEMGADPAGLWEPAALEPAVKARG